MASKKYGYYNKGNKIALIEQADSTSSGRLAVAHCTLSSYTTKDTCEAAGGQWIPGSSGSVESFGEYKSPVESIAKGLEIEYSYAPIYNVESQGTEGTDFHRFVGWGSDGANLLLFTFGPSDYYDISSIFSADDWIYIEGSGRWSGLHQVKSTGSATGILTLKTKCNLRPSKITVDGTFAVDETYNGDSAAFDMDIEAFKDAQTYRSVSYVFITVENDNATNKGLFSLSSDTTSGRLTVNNRIAIDADGDYTSTAAAFTAQADDASTFYNAFYEQISVYTSIDVMDDESFELDLTRYQANAVVHYLKAKMFEDGGDIEKHEYYMRQFKRQLEKASGSRKYGPHIIQGHWNMRK